MLDTIARLIVKKTGGILHLPYFEATFAVEQRIEGELVSPVIHRPVKSWVRNAYNFLARQAMSAPCMGTYGAGNLRMRRTHGGDNHATSESTALLEWHISTKTLGRGYRAIIGDNNHGIVIGTSTTAWNFEHRAMQGLIPDGGGSGQVHYNQMEVYTVDVGGIVKKIHLQRYFNNNSGANLTLGEIGLIASIEQGWGSTGPGKYLFSREVVSPADTFYDKAQLKVDYEISLTYPS